MTDSVVQAINDAIAEGRAGDADSARAKLLELWTGIGVLGDPVHRCWLAHSLADLYDDPAQALAWNVRALDAAEAADEEQTRAFYPSLYLNLADDYRRLGSFDTAAAYLARAQARVADLPDDAYGETMRPIFGVLAEFLARRDTGPLSAPAG